MKKLLTLILLSAATTALAELPYVGASAGYMIDMEEHFFAGRIGSEVAHKNGLAHAIEIEVGLMSPDESGVSLDLVPVFANYRLSSVGERKVGYYAGAGLGSARLKVSYLGFEDSSWTFAGQAFGGVEYRVTPKFSLTAGLRYIWLDDVTVFGVEIDEGDDLAIEVGVRFRL
jgi:opacity protein-like surface antigen